MALRKWLWLRWREPVSMTRPLAASLNCLNGLQKTGRNFLLGMLRPVVFFVKLSLSLEGQFNADITAETVLLAGQAEHTGVKA